MTKPTEDLVITVPHAINEEFLILLDLAQSSLVNPDGLTLQEVETLHFIRNLLESQNFIPSGNDRNHLAHCPFGKEIAKQCTPSRADDCGSRNDNCPK
jgi:hypothetical protein